jgi:lipoate-protein ligase A
MTLERKVFLLEEQPKAPSENLARNQHFVNLIKDKKYDLIARMYRHTNGVILGHHESTNDVDLNFCRENGYEIVRRPTGGSAVVVNPEIAICYTIMFDPETINKTVDIPKLYKEITIPLAKNLGSDVTVEGAYYLRIKRNGTNTPFAGHAIKMYDGKIVQFDGMINRTSFDIETLSRALKLRQLYTLNGEKYVVVDGQSYNLKGTPTNFDVENATLIGNEREELEKIQGLKEIGLDDNYFLKVFKKTLTEVFGEVKTTALNPDSQILSVLQEEFRQNEEKGNKSGLGHCYVDFVEPEPRIHYATS